MAVPGVLMRLVEPGEAREPSRKSSLSPAYPCLNVQARYTLRADDGRTPSLNSVYFLSDITPIISSPSAYDEDLRIHGSEVTSIAWVVCAFINGRDGSEANQPITSLHVLPNSPKIGSLLVVNGSTPRHDKEQDYHDWYDQEHGNKLTLVPGWNSARRYRLARVYGEAEAANFYGFNYYDENNGLGGPEWKAGVTEWTLRIRSNAAKPNIRRVWKVEKTLE